MNRPSIKYLISSPYGDIPVDKNKWHLPLEYDTLNTPYKTYFNSIREFLIRDESKLLLEAASKKLERGIQLKGVEEIVIRSEKHGSFYHPASVELFLKDGRVKFGLNVAISDMGRYWLKEECNVLQKLHTKFDLPYLPRVYFSDELSAMSFLLEDWFEGYHEFHISKDNEGIQRLKLWDFDQGYTYLSPEQSFEIYKQASKILTLYYDLNDLSQISSWHHAAGDFVVKIEDKKNPPESPPFWRRVARGDCKEGTGGFSDKGIDVRLTTARRYEPFIGFVGKNTLNPILAICYYLLDLTIRMRLDKLDGLGEVVWADDNCVEATLTGFFEALKLKRDLKHHLGQTEDFAILLRVFTPEELKTIFDPLIDYYRGTADFPVIISNLNKHIDKLYTTLQILPL